MACGSALHPHREPRSRSPATPRASAAADSPARHRQCLNDKAFRRFAATAWSAGFSGAPWITGSTVSGVIGGLDGGGCDDEVSYSPPFDDAVTALLARAEAGGPGDGAPTAFDDGC